MATRADGEIIFSKESANESEHILAERVAKERGGIKETLHEMVS